jgi:ureidoglycolate dehydrogenase (NAD+)
MAGVPVLAPVHAGAPGAKRHRQNAAVIVVDPATFGDATAFARTAAETLAAIRDLPALGDDRVAVPGDRGGAMARRLIAEGISLPARTVDEINSLATAAELTIRLN